MASQVVGPYRRQERFAPRGTWTRERVLAALCDWAAEFGQAPAAHEWSVAGARARGDNSVRVRRWAAEHPRWPSVTTVVSCFGSWSAGLEAGGLRDERIAPWHLKLPERVQIARRLSGEGVSAVEVAALLDVQPGTVRTYLHAGSCPECGDPVVNRSAHHCQRCAARLAHRPAWTREAIVAALRDWAEQYGKPPSAEDWAPSEDRRRRWSREYPRWPSSGQLVSVFGAWNAALQTAGFTPRPPPPTWGRERILETVGAFVKREGRSPTTDELGGYELPSSGTIVSHFGSLAALRIELGLPASTYEWDKERIIYTMREYAETHGRPPKVSDWRAANDSHPDPGTVARRFGSWGTALAAAGFLPRRFSWDDMAIVEAINAHLRENGQLPTPVEWAKRDPAGRRPAYFNVQQRFGSWDAALQAAGHTVEHWDRESITAAIRELGVRMGRRPVQSDLRPKRAGLPGYDQTAAVFGSFTAALRAAGFHTSTRKWSRQATAQALGDWAKANGRSPTYNDWKTSGGEHPTAGVVARLFGSWPAGLAAANLSPNRGRR
jgi:hypothetical protein